VLEKEKMVINMNLKTDNIRIVKSGFFHFTLQYHRTFEYRKPLDYWLNILNINDYWIYKMTSKQRIVSIEEFMDFKYAGYIFFKKEKYNKDDINKWLDYYYENIDEIKILSRPLPPFPPTKIIIKK